MQAYTEENTLALAEKYATANKCNVFIYEIKNGMHQTVWFEYYAEGAAELRFFGRDPDIVINPACPKCGGSVGHRINCPDGIAFS